MGEIHEVAVVGAGTMGHGIAQVAALAGYAVKLFDAMPDAAASGLEKIRATLAQGVSKGKVSVEAKERALRGLKASLTLQEAAGSANLVIEAVPENLETKRRLFEELGRLCREDTILATNTSSLSVTAIAESTTCPERVVGLHFFNPPHIMKLVEIVRARQTSDSVMKISFAIAKRMGKEAIGVRDSPGFATSRLGLAVGLEAMRMVEEGVASAEDIDRAMELGYGHPMGPLRVSDLVGLDVRLSIAETLQEGLDGSRFRPPGILREKVKAGMLGKKTGEGFYRWKKN